MDKAQVEIPHDAVDVDRVVTAVVAGLATPVLGLLMWLDVPGPQDLRTKRIVIPRGFYVPDTPASRHCLIVLCGGKSVRVARHADVLQDVIVEATVHTKTRNGWADVATVMQDAADRAYNVGYVRDALNG